MIGLIQAADSWEPGRGLKFSTYAYTKIRGAILDELRRLDFLPRGRREKVRELERVISQLEQQNGVAPTPEVIAETLGTTLDEVDEILLSAKSAACASLDGEISKELLGLLSDPRSEDPQGSVEWLEMKDLLVRSITELPEQDKTVITLYYAEELLLREIAQVLGVTESRVSQIHTRALYRLNAALSASIGTPG
jgi:RNA polymerase sigma factor for flagellar operon FliA